MSSWRADWSLDSFRGTIVRRLTGCVIGLGLGCSAGRSLGWGFCLCPGLLILGWFRRGCWECLCSIWLVLLVVWCILVRLDIACYQPLSPAYQHTQHYHLPKIWSSPLSSSSHPSTKTPSQDFPLSPSPSYYPSPLHNSSLFPLHLSPISS